MGSDNVRPSSEEIGVGQRGGAVSSKVRRVLTLSDFDVMGARC